MVYVRCRKSCSVRKEATGSQDKDPGGSKGERVVESRPFVGNWLFLEWRKRQSAASEAKGKVGERESVSPLPPPLTPPYAIMIMCSSPT